MRWATSPLPNRPSPPHRFCVASLPAADLLTYQPSCPLAARLHRSACFNVCLCVLYPSPPSPAVGTPPAQCPPWGRVPAAPLPSILLPTHQLAPSSPPHPCYHLPPFHIARGRSVGRTLLAKISEAEGLLQRASADADVGRCRALVALIADCVALLPAVQQQAGRQ